MNISTIIPTYNRPETLMRALASLQEQTLSDFEMLVVDNAADPAVQGLATEFNRTAKVPVRYVPEPDIGLHNARHAGAIAAQGDILVFTDDDATFDSGWLEAYAEKFADYPEMAAAGGPVRAAWEQPPPGWLLELIGEAKMFGPLSVMEPYDEFCLGGDAFFWGANMAIRRRVLFEVGGFNPECFGDTWLGDGESGLKRKLNDRQMLVGYVPGAVVYHHIPPQRMTVEYLRHRQVNQGAAEAYTYFHAEGVRRTKVLAYAARIAKDNLRAWAQALIVNGRTDARSLGVQLNATAAKSQLSYAIRLLTDRSFRELVTKKDWLATHEKERF